MDGQSACRQDVTVQLQHHGLCITTASGRIYVWPYETVRQTHGTCMGEQVRLERNEAAPESLVIPHRAFLTALHQRAPQTTSLGSPPRHRARRLLYTCVAASAALAILASLYLWGIPALAGLVAAHVPVAWEERLGQSIVQHLAPEIRRCTDPLRLRIIAEIMATLTAPLADQPYTLRLLVVDDAALNAFAAPGGYIVLFRGLLAHTHSAEELAGVLAHEMQHILQRHATRLLLQHASTGMLLSALRGEAHNGLGYGLESARLLGALRYSRRMEEEADIAGMQLLQAAGVDARGMITLFATLKEASEDYPAFLTYVSTHPSPETRLQRLTALASTIPRPTTKLLPNYDWHDINNVCQNAP